MLTPAQQTVLTPHELDWYNACIIGSTTTDRELVVRTWALADARIERNELRDRLERIESYIASQIGQPPHDRDKRLNNADFGLDGINHFDDLEELQSMAKGDA